MLFDIEATVDDPLQGIELVSAFYQTDEAVFESCDDSEGSVGDVYCRVAGELFSEYASNCEQKTKILEKIIDLNREDNYGVRDAVFKHASLYLPEPDIRRLISELEGLVTAEKNEYQKRHWLGLIEMLARQIKDVPLFIKMRMATEGELSTASCLEIARIYMAGGHPQKALEWIEKIEKNDRSIVYELDRLRVDIYRQLGDVKKLTALLLKKFQNFYSIDYLNDLLDVIGHKRKEEIVEQEAGRILAQVNLDYIDAQFLMGLGRIEEAEKYLLDRAGQLDGHQYYRLLDMAKKMEAESRFLVASLIYRSLLDAILERGKSKAYHYGVEYLRKLDQLADIIQDWGPFDHHGIYKDRLIENHGRKYGFWEQYGG